MAGLEHLALTVSLSLMMLCWEPDRVGNSFACEGFYTEATTIQQEASLEPGSELYTVSKEFQKITYKTYKVYNS
jgi:hypothetical protein